MDAHQDYGPPGGGPGEERKTITWLEKADEFDLTVQFSKVFLIFILSASFNRTPVVILADMEFCSQGNCEP